VISLNLPVLKRLVLKKSEMRLYEIDPRTDPRWAALVDSHPLSSVFHTVEWLDALHKTYKYIPRAFTSTQPGAQLTSALVFCQVDSLITGSRLVSLPFSDHCDPLVWDSVELRWILSELRKQTAGYLKYLEVRPRSIEVAQSSEIFTCAQYCLSVIDLRPSIDELYSRLDRDSVQRKLRRAEREHLVLEKGRSEKLIEEFYELLVLTRRRHQLPPQPLSWFRNLVQSFGDRLTIRIARKDDNPIASILTLQHKKTIIYKYGCSNAQFHNAGGMPFLFWDAIKYAKSEQLEEFDLGRSEPANDGLIRFKEHLGAQKISLDYSRSPRSLVLSVGEAAQSRLAQKVLSHLPDRLFRLAGEIFYRHIG
jgi:hypothetical protein